jgi:transporter family-2 protein
VALVFVSGEGFGRLGEVGGLSWYYLIGGLLGAVYVTTVLISVRTLGAGGVTAATIAGQLTLSVVLDQLGVLGLAQREITPARMVGVALLAAGVVLVVRN